MWDMVWQDVRYATRSLHRTPGFAATAVMTLALGIGAAVAMFSIVDAALLRALPFPQAERLTAVWERPPAGAAWTRQTVPSALLEDWVRQARSFEALAGISGRDFTLNTPDGPLRIAGSVITPDFFPTLRVGSALGRALSDPSSLDAQSVVISHALWRRHFGSDPEIVGRVLDLDHLPHTVVAVLPDIPIPSMGPQPDVWVPVTSTTRPTRLMVIGRLRDQVEPAAAEAELTTIQRTRGSDATGVLVRPLQGDAAELSKPTLAILSLAVGLLLVIACVNVAAMLLERVFVRRRELGIRTSVGATARRLATQLGVEQLLLWSCGGFAGVLFGAALLRALVRTPGFALLEGVAPEFIAFDGRVLLFAAVITATGALVFGIVPAIASSRANVVNMLRSGPASSGTRARPRRLLVAREVALALALLVNAGLLVDSYNRLSAQSVGIRDAGYLTFRLELPQTRYGDHPRRMQFHEALLRELRAVPGMESVGVGSARPLGGVPVGPFEVERPATAGGGMPLAGIEAADPEFFGAAGIPLLAGRVFDSADQGATTVAIVNETLSRRFFGETSALGRRIRVGPAHDQTPWLTIVGIVGDVRHAGLDWDVLPEVYVPYAHASDSRLAFISRDLHIVLQHRAGASMTAKAIQDAVWTVDRTLPVTELASYSALISDAAARPAFRMAIVSALAAFAVLLSAVGLFGVLSFVVRQRRTEIGVRMAVGADRQAVVRLVLSDMAALAVWGVAAGIPLGWAGSQVVETVLFGVRRSDAIPYVAAALVILATAMLSATIPAIRATRIDPVSVLQAE